MSPIPSTTASLYGGFLPSKPGHSLTDPEQTAAALRASRLDSFLSEPPSEGNRLALFTVTQPATALSSTCHSSGEKGPGDDAETGGQTTSNNKATYTAANRC